MCKNRSSIFSSGASFPHFQNFNINQEEFKKTNMGTAVLKSNEAAGRRVCGTCFALCQTFPSAADRLPDEGCRNCHGRLRLQLSGAGLQVGSVESIRQTSHFPHPVRRAAPCSNFNHFLPQLQVQPDSGKHSP